MTALAGRNAIVTGGSRGIGFAIAAALREAGASVCITGRKADALEQARVDLGGDGVIAIAGNTADEGHREETVDAVVRKFGSIDLLVNNTGISPAYGPLVDADLDAVRKTYDTNVVGALGWIRAAYRRSLGDGGGAVVNVASIAGMRPAENIGAYALSKAGLIAMTQQLAVELAPRVRVNAVAPGVVRTKFAAAMYERDEGAVAARYPLNRLGSPEDVASAVVFLLSSQASWITGTTIVVDGGLLQTGGV